MVDEREVTILREALIKEREGTEREKNICLAIALSIAFIMAGAVAIVGMYRLERIRAIQAGLSPGHVTSSEYLLPDRQ